MARFLVIIAINPKTIKPDDATDQEWLQYYHPEEVERFDKGLLTDPAKDQVVN